MKNIFNIKKLIVLFYLTFIAISLFAQDFKVDKFRSIPEEMMGCGCWFSLNKAEYNKNTYIYGDDFDNGIISINGILTKFNLKHSLYDEGNNGIINFYNNEYSVIIKTKLVKSYSELQIRIGTITIKNKRTRKQKILSLYGGCGC